MKSRNLQPIATFVEKLGQLCSQEMSGVLYFVSPDEHAGHIIIRRGEIIILRYYTQRGTPVIETLQSLTQLSYRFMDKAVNRKEDDSLPTTEEILIRLSLQVPHALTDDT